MSTEIPPGNATDPKLCKECLSDIDVWGHSTTCSIGNKERAEVSHADFETQSLDKDDYETYRKAVEDFVASYTVGKDPDAVAQLVEDFASKLYSRGSATLISHYPPRAMSFDERLREERTEGASGKTARPTSKENPFYKLEIIAGGDLWWGGVDTSIAKVILWHLDGYLWELINGDSFHTVQDGRWRIEEIRNRLSAALTREESAQFWPSLDAEMQLVLIDAIRVLPLMWD